MKARLAGALLISSVSLVIGAGEPAEAITYTFDNVQFPAGSSGPFTITGSFDFDGTTVTNFQDIEVTRWLESGTRNPTGAGFNPSSIPTPNQLFFLDGSTQNNPQSIQLFLIPDGLTGAPQSINLSGKSGVVQWCNNNGCPGPQFNQEQFTFSSGTLTAVPAPFTALALLPLAGLKSYRRRLIRLSQTHTAKSSCTESG